MAAAGVVLLVESEQTDHVLVVVELGRLDFGGCPVFGVGDLVAGFEDGERSEGFEFEVAALGVDFDGAAEVGILVFVEILELLDERDVLVDVRAPALGGVEADLGRRALRGLLHEHEFVAVDEPGIGGTGIRPEVHGAVRDESLGAVVHRENGGAAGHELGDAPRGGFDVPEAFVADLVLDAEGIVALGIDIDGLHDAGELLARGHEGDAAVAEFGHDDFAAVGAVGTHAVLRGVPDAVAAVIGPDGLVGRAEKLLVEVKEIRALAEERAHDAGADLGGHDDAEIAVGEFDAVFPALESDLFDLHTVKSPLC